MTSLEINQDDLYYYKSMLIDGDQSYSKNYLKLSSRDDFKDLPKVVYDLLEKRNIKVLTYLMSSLQLDYGLIWKLENAPSGLQRNCLIAPSYLTDFLRSSKKYKRHLIFHGRFTQELTWDRKKIINYMLDCIYELRNIWTVRLTIEKNVKHINPKRIRNPELLQLLNDFILNVLDYSWEALRYIIDFDSKKSIFKKTNGASIVKDQLNQIITLYKNTIINIGGKVLSKGSYLHICLGCIRDAILNMSEGGSILNMLSSVSGATRHCAGSPKTSEYKKQIEWQETLLKGYLLSDLSRDYSPNQSSDDIIQVLHTKYLETQASFILLGCET